MVRHQVRRPENHRFLDSINHPLPDTKPQGFRSPSTYSTKQIPDILRSLDLLDYGLRELVQNFDAKPAKIKALFANQLDPIRASELRDRMRRLAGLPI